jgi:hypothetical protein
MRRERNLSNRISGISYTVVISTKSSRHPLAKTWLCQSHAKKCVWSSTNEFVSPADSACFRFPWVSLPFVAQFVQRSSILCRSQWPRRLRPGSAAARCLGLQFRIAPDQWCLSLVSVVCSQVEISLRLADHSSRRVLPSAVCLSVITKPKKCEGSGPLWLSSHKNRTAQRESQYAPFSVPLLRHLLQPSSLLGTQRNEVWRDIHLSECCNVLDASPLALLIDSTKAWFSKKVCEQVELFIFWSNVFEDVRYFRVRYPVVVLNDLMNKITDRQ